MKALTNEKLTIVGAAGMIGSNMAQTALMMNLTSELCLYDPFALALEGVAEEMFHCSCYFQSGRYYRFDHSSIFRIETFTGNNFGCIG